MTEERENRLPRWAQTELSRLRSNVEHWKHIATAPERPTEESNTSLALLGDRGIREDKGLGDSPTIRFRLGDGSELEARIEHDKLIVYINNGIMSVVPQSSNVVRIGAGEYR